MSASSGDGEFSGIRVVVVDDEPPVAEGIAILLELEGASVTTLPRGRDAVALADRGDAIIDVFIIDLGLPEMSGDELHAELRRRLPEVPILVSSGYAEQERIQPLLARPHTRFLRKPYEMSELYAAVRELLAAR